MSDNNNWQQRPPFSASGMNFTESIFFPRRFILWFFGGFTVFQMGLSLGVMLVSLFAPQIIIAVMSIWVPIVGAWQLRLSLAFLFFIAGGVAGVVVSRLVDIFNVNGKQQHEWVIDWLKLRFGALAMVDGLPYKADVYGTRSELSVVTRRKKVDHGKANVRKLPAPQRQAVQLETQEANFAPARY